MTVIGVVENLWEAHIVYLEDEVTKISGRAERLKALIPLMVDRRNTPSRVLVDHLSDEAGEHRKHLVLVKHRRGPMPSRLQHIGNEPV